MHVCTKESIAIKGMNIGFVLKCIKICLKLQIHCGYIIT